MTEHADGPDGGGGREDDQIELSMPPPGGEPESGSVGRVVYLIVGAAAGIALGFLLFRNSPQQPEASAETEAEEPASTASCPACPSAAQSAACAACASCPTAQMLKGKGTLRVHGPSIADVFVNGELAGAVDTPIVVSCGPAEVELRIGAHAASRTQKVDIGCDKLTEITLKHETPP